MKRSVRNGIAIAGMAGGLWLLGQAVASADEGSAASGADTTVTQTDGGGGGNANLSDNSASAENKDITKVETDVTGGSGGSNSADINTGVLPGGMPTNSDQMLSVANESPSGPPKHEDNNGTTVTLNTGDVSATQQANGGDVNDSGNVAVAGGGSQTATANATTTVDQTSTGSDNKHGDEHHNDGKNGHDQGGNFNGSENSADSSNVDVTKVETDVTGGSGGTNSADINTGIIGNFYCEKGGCTYNITTGSVTLNQQANGGNVNGSGNVGIGVPAPGTPSPCTCKKPEEHKAAAAAPAKAAPVSHRSSAAALSSAQPSGQLAFTGAQTTLPLTLGLLALGLGGALTLAGRRRETATI